MSGTGKPKKKAHVWGSDARTTVSIDTGRRQQSRPWKPNYYGDCPCPMPTSCTDLPSFSCLRQLIKRQATPDTSPSPRHTTARSRMSRHTTPQYRHTDRYDAVRNSRGAATATPEVSTSHKSLPPQLSWTFGRRGSLLTEHSEFVGAFVILCDSLHVIAA